MRKRSSNQQNMKQAIDDLLSVYKLKRGVDEAAVKAAWVTAMGAPIAKKTRQLKLVQGTLKIYLDSGVLKEEFSFEKPRIIALLNEELGRDVIKLIEIY